jgi:hypothetical protein
MTRLASERRERTTGAERGAGAPALRQAQGVVSLSNHASERVGESERRSPRSDQGRAGKWWRRVARQEHNDGQGGNARGVRRSGFKTAVNWSRSRNLYADLKALSLANERAREPTRAERGSWGPRE